ncbi:MAG: tol-pal system protein YbgF [Alphaproteobacteria bacterium]|nr:tol-pal system protein YbgF [Alphaproteobacteria bacterium]
MQRIQPVTPLRLSGIGRWRAAVIFSTVIAATVLAAPTLVHAQSRELPGLADALRRLELQVQVLERTVFQGRDVPAPSLLEVNPADPTSAAQLLIRLGEMEQVLRTVTGRLEQLENDVTRQASLIERLGADFDFRLRVLEEAGQQLASAPSSPGLPAPTSTSTPQTSTPQTATPPTLKPPTLKPPPLPTRPPGPVVLRSPPPSPSPTPLSIVPVAPASPPSVTVAGPSFSLPAGSPQTQYNFAYDFLLQGRYSEAQAAFQAFVVINPDDPLAGNSQYWLGETHYARGQYDDAARAFARGFERYPNSGKVTHNLLKLGMSLAQLDQNENACNTLGLLLNEYPQAPSSVRERANRERTSLAC